MEKGTFIGLFVRSNVSNVGTSLQCTVGKYINCLVQFPKFCTQETTIGPQNNVYNSIIVNQLHGDVFVKTKTGLYSQALLPTTSTPLSSPA